MPLKDELDSIKATFAQKNDPAIVAAYEKGIDELRAAGIEANALKPGELAPDFTLPDATGRPVKLSERLKAGPVVLKFYRGGWCPYCNLELRAYQKALPELAAVGAQLIAVSPESPDNSLSTKEKNALAFSVLSDRGGATARAYRLAFGRPPTPTERAWSQDFLREQWVRYAKEPGKQPQEITERAFADFCHALLSANEFIYVD